ncbi:ABC transporter ATP-binding protein [Thermodesulforhabdus norvegica]|uniref:ABC-2 type transport system ATP-binding protein n=1 Tax=Thermodesulforhabdus norvegica TaxID=39841 RepID=A0A1I4S5B3_9BACT|nr:ABC transporter ATP-binding protein [Thermodesulforhabdus norvegica]SFM59561.1 ABC-2 type transport system ATP-binding protein [Thermodesulforhabdus norvegica]
MAESAATKPVAIEIRGLKKRYRQVEALKGITLKVKEGELFAYLGPNGSGKTTTIKILVGLARASEGEAFVNGYNVEKESINAKRQCGYVPQAINLDHELTVEENLDIHGRLFDMSRSYRRERIDYLLEYVGLKDRKKSPVKELSGGMKRRVMIARALLHEPKVLFLDEPTVGLDPAIRRKIWALVKKIQMDGTTIFLTTHYIEEAEFLADRVAFLSEGTIITVGKPQELIDDLGRWALDVVENERMHTLYFPTQEEAKRHAVLHPGAFSVRRVNLEDVFLSLTGQRVG